MYPPRPNPMVPLLILAAIGAIIYYTLKIYCPPGFKRNDDGECVCEKNMQVTKDGKCVCDDSSVLNETTQECECPSHATYNETDKKCDFSYYWTGRLSDIQGNIDADDKDKELIKGYNWGSINYIPCRFEEGGEVYKGYIDIHDPTICKTVTREGEVVTSSTASDIQVMLPKKDKSVVFKIANTISNFNDADSTEAYRFGWGPDQKMGGDVCRNVDDEKYGNWTWTNAETEASWKCLSEDYPNGTDKGDSEFVYDPEKTKT